MTRVFRFLDTYPRVQWLGVLAGVALMAALVLITAIWLLTFEGN